MKKIFRKKHPSRTHPEKQFQKELISTTLNSIDRVKAHIHRVQLSGAYKYEEINGKLGRLQLANNSKIAKRRRKQYKTTAYCRLEDANLIVHTNPVKGVYPKCMIQFSNASPEILFSILKALPKLIISSVEYTIDIYPKDPDDVPDLFYLIRRYAYFHDSSETHVIGGEYYGYGEPRDTNRAIK